MGVAKVIRRGRSRRAQDEHEALQGAGWLFREVVGHGGTLPDLDAGRHDVRVLARAGALRGMGVQMVADGRVRATWRVVKRYDRHPVMLACEPATPPSPRMLTRCTWRFVVYCEAAALTRHRDRLALDWRPAGGVPEERLSGTVDRPVRGDRDGRVTIVSTGDEVRLPSAEGRGLLADTMVRCTVTRDVDTGGLIAVTVVPEDESESVRPLVDGWTPRSGDDRFTAHDRRRALPVRSTALGAPEAADRAGRLGRWLWDGENGFFERATAFIGVLAGFLALIDAVRSVLS